jgi:hypothetical protein
MTFLHSRFAVRSAVAAAILAGACTAAAQSSSSPGAERGAAPPPTQTIEAEPIRCWWRLSSGAVRTGEVFTLALTCAVLENDQVQIVPDESRLGTAVVQLTPFDIVDGVHPADLHTANRRFFQYEYHLRMINPDFIGKDVPIPDMTRHFRVNSRMTGGAALQGRDFVYSLPPLTVKILNMVPGDAVDIRDSSSQSFTGIETLRFRASMLRIVAITLLAAGGLIALLSLVRVLRRATKKSTKPAYEISDGAVLGAVSREISAIQQDAEGGWSAPLVARALAAARIAGGYAIGRRAAQQAASNGTADEGRIGVRARRGVSTAVWSTVTPNDFAALNGNARNGLSNVDDLRAALSTLTVAQFARESSFDRSSLDAALNQVAGATSELKQHHSWPRTLLRRFSPGGSRNS